MIELFRVAMFDDLAIAGAGQRVRQLAQSLDFSVAEATRLGVATRELAAKSDLGADLVIGIEYEHEAARLALIFNSSGPDNQSLEKIAALFFDTVSFETETLLVSCCLPDSTFKATQEWVAKTQLKLTETTVSELRAALQRKNAELSLFLATLNKKNASMLLQNEELAVAYQELERLRAKEYVLARYDTVTGLPTRALFEDRLEQAIELAHRNDQTVCVFFIDLDHFKQINDTHGHAAGDFLLKEVGQRMRDTVRASDTVARLGGDEFAIILQNPTKPKHVEMVAQKLIASICQPIKIREDTVSVGASLGIALYPDNAETAKDLLKRADEAMYDVKRQGRNSYRFSHAYSSDNQNEGGT